MRFYYEKCFIIIIIILTTIIVSFCLTFDLYNYTLDINCRIRHLYSLIPLYVFIVLRFLLSTTFSFKSLFLFSFSLCNRYTYAIKALSLLIKQVLYFILSLVFSNSCATASWYCLFLSFSFCAHQRPPEVQMSGTFSLPHRMEAEVAACDPLPHDTIQGFDRERQSTSQ